MLNMVLTAVIESLFDMLVKTGELVMSRFETMPLLTVELTVTTAGVLRL
jgi:hypothetical protein